MEKYFYILIGVAWVIYNIYKKSQKQNAKHQQSSQAQQSTKKSLLEELLGGEQFDSPAAESLATDHPYNNYEIEEFENNTIDTYDETSNNINTIQREEPIEIIKPIEKNKKKAEDENIVNQFDLNDFDLRKAVIYSEILKRPYS